MFTCCNFFTKRTRIPPPPPTTTTTTTTASTASTGYQSVEEIKKINPKVFLPPIEFGRVLSVYDGDTITIASMLNINNTDELYRFSIRLKGIDTPEMRAKTAHEKDLAILARDALSKRIYGQIIQLKNVTHDKYGTRYIADVYLKDEHINAYMLENKYAVPYDGKTKKNDWSDVLKI